MITAFIAYDNLDQELGDYFEACGTACQAYLKEFNETDATIINGTTLNQVNVDIRLTANNSKPFLFLAYSHGKEDSLVATNQPYVKSGVNTSSFTNALVYTNACLAAKKLGPDLITAGAIAFVGYTETINVLLHNEAMTSLCQHIDNYALILFLKQDKSIGQAVEDAKTFITRKALGFEDNTLSPLDAAELLRVRDSMKVFGDNDLLLSDLIKDKY